MTAPRRRLLWDCSHVAAHPDINTGIERVVRELGAALAVVAGDRGLDLVPCVTDGTARVHRLARLPRLGDPPWVPDGSAVIPGGEDVWVLADNVLDPARLIGLSPWWRAGMRVVLVQHDLVPLRHPSTTTPATAAHFSRWMFEAVAFADAFVSVSLATASALAEAIPRLAPWRTPAAAELPVVHLASTWHPDRRAARPAAGQDWRFVAVGTVEPRKRYDLLLDAFEDHWAGGGGTRLTVVGRAGWNTAATQKRLARLAADQPNFEWMAGASDEQLRENYLAAHAFVSLSSEEGFGLPVVEAAAAGLPLVLSDIPVYREIARDGARFVPAAADQARPALAALLDSLGRTGADLPGPDPALAGRTWNDAAADFLAALAGLPPPSLELRGRWDHRAALALAAAQAPAARRLAPGPEASAGPVPDHVVEGGSLSHRAVRRYSAWRLRVPAAVIRAMQARNQVFRLLLQLDARTSAIETKVAALTRTTPTANALQQIRAAEAEQNLRYQLESVLSEIEALIDQMGGAADLDAPRRRVGRLRERLRSRSDG